MQNKVLIKNKQAVMADGLKEKSHTAAAYLVKKEPSTLWAGGAPISSVASLSAVLSRSVSSGSALPPGRPILLGLPLVFARRRSKHSSWQLNKKAYRQENGKCTLMDVVYTNITRKCIQDLKGHIT